MKPHPNLIPEINEAIAQSERDGGVFLKNLETGDVVTVETRNSTYVAEIVDGRKVNISGGFLKETVEAIIQGSTWGGSMMKLGFVGKGMHMEFDYAFEDRFKTATTSSIENIHVKTKTLNYDVKQEELN